MPRFGSGAILYAVNKRWTDMKMNTIFTGGLHMGTAPKDTKMPYCVLNVAAETPVMRTSNGDFDRTEYSRVLLDFVVFHQNGLQAATDASEAIRLKFDNPDLVLQTGEGTVLEFRWVSSTPVQHPTIPSVWAYTVSYDVLRQRPDIIN